MFYIYYNLLNLFTKFLCVPIYDRVKLEKKSSNSPSQKQRFQAALENASCSENP